VFTELKTQRINPISADDGLPGFAWLPAAVNRAVSTHEAVLAYGPKTQLSLQRGQMPEFGS
jgi:hypothetical protein